MAFYDAVATNESAVRKLGGNILAVITRDLVRAIRADVTVDWTIREQVQALLRTKVKRLLAVHGYPPDGEEKAVDLVLQQTKTFTEQWAACPAGRMHAAGCWVPGHDDRGHVPHAVQITSLRGRVHRRAASLECRRTRPGGMRRCRPLGNR